MASTGIFLEVRPVSRQACTFEVEGQGLMITATVELQEEAGTIRPTLTNLCASKQARDAMAQFGAAAGAKVAWDQLADVLGER